VTFERPDAWWLLALAAPLVALHLHLRRRHVVEVSSVELWRGLLDGRAGRGRFRKLRDASALALLLAALVAFTGAAAGPVTGTAASAGRRLTIVVDASASMCARAKGRLPRLLQAAADVDDMDFRLAPQDELTVWLVDERPHVVLGPSRARDAATNANWMQRRSLARADIGAATKLAMESTRGGTTVVLTDALGCEALDGFDWKGADVRIGAVDAGYRSSNAGIVAFDVDPADANRAVVRVAITDGSPTPLPLVLTSAGKELSRATLTYDAAGVATASLPLGEAARKGGLVTARLDSIDAYHGDDFAPDDVAELMLPATKPLAVAVVADKPSPFLVEALRAMPDVVDLAKTTLVAPNAPASAFAGADVVIADGVAAPAGMPSLAFLATGKSVEKPLLWGVGTHAVLAGVDLSPLRIAHAVVLDVAAGETPIVATSAGAVGVAGETNGVRRVALGFRPDASTLPLEAAFPLLVRNALRWLAKPSDAQRFVVAGEPWPDGDGALVPYPAPGGPYVVRTPTGAETVVRWIPPKGFHLSPQTPTNFPSASEVVASLDDRHLDRDTRERHAPLLAAVGAALLALGALVVPRPRTSKPRVEIVAAAHEPLVASR